MHELQRSEVRVDKRRCPVGIGYPADMPQDVRARCRGIVQEALTQARSLSWFLGRISETGTAMCFCYVGARAEGLRDGHELPGQLKLIP